MHENESYCRALQIIQEEEYLEAADIDEIKIRKKTFTLEPPKKYKSYLETIIDILINTFNNDYQRPDARQKRQSMGTDFMVSDQFMGAESIDDIINLYDKID